jgi:hypothetical protein
MGGLYQSPMDQLAIRFGALSLDERPETQVPWTWQFKSMNEPYKRPGTPVIPKKDADVKKRLKRLCRTDPFVRELVRMALLG